MITFICNSYFSECRSKREMPSLYPQAKGIMSALKEKGIEMAIASRSPTSDIANTFIGKLNIKSMFVAKVRLITCSSSSCFSPYVLLQCGSLHLQIVFLVMKCITSFWDCFQEIFSSWSHKTEHFQKIHTRTNVPFTSMLFFDDEDRNIKSVNTKLSFCAS